MPVHLANHLAAGHHVPGILLLDDRLSLGQITEELALIWGASEAEEYGDKLTYVPVRS